MGHLLSFGKFYKMECGGGTNSDSVLLVCAGTCVERLKDLLCTSFASDGFHCVHTYHVEYCWAVGHCRALPVLLTLVYHSPCQANLAVAQLQSFSASKYVILMSGIRMAIAEPALQATYAYTRVRRVAHCYIVSFFIKRHISHKHQNARGQRAA